MKQGQSATSPGVIIVNVSLGDRNKPFVGRMSGWARVIDYLSNHYGVLFVISAGNHFADLDSNGIGSIEFENMDAAGRARLALVASKNTMASRRVLAPAESMNALTVGSLHSDSHPPSALPTAVFDVWANTGLCNVSSALGPGHGGAIKPDLLAPGGRHHVRLSGTGDGHRLTPLTTAAGSLGGIRVAVPPRPANPDPNQTGLTVGTSVAAALATGLATRAHETLESVYDNFLQIPGPQRALLLKALLVHCARWTEARDLIIDVLGPDDPKQNVRQKDNVRRYLGYGAIAPDIVLGCTTDRATLWGVGQLNREQAHKFFVPLPAAISGKAQLHELSATVSWFAPPRVGAAKYRGVRLKLMEPGELASFGVSASAEQPDFNQAHRGTVIHRRWIGEKAAALADDATIELMVQRQPDELDEPVPYAIVTTVTMPGVNEIYAQVRARVAVQPRVSVRA
jgi:Subtilase family